MSTFLGADLSSITTVVALTAAGTMIVSISKLYNFVFMRGQQPHRIGATMQHAKAEVTEWSGTQGYVRADGELWRARSKQTLIPGDRVKIAHVDGLVVTVKRKQ